MDDQTIHENLGVLERIISDKESRKVLQREDIELFTLAHDFMESRLRTTLPSLVQDSDLASASNEIDSAIVEINNYLGNEVEGHLVNARSKLKTAVNRIKNLPIPVKGDTFDFTSEIKAFKKSVSDESANLSKEFGTLRDELKSVQIEITERKMELAELITCIEEKGTEINALNSTFQKQYDTDRTSHMKKIEDQENEIKKNTDSIVKYLETKKGDAAKIVNVIGNIGVTGNFQKIANDHKKSAGIWRVIAISFMAVLSGLIVWSILSLSQENYDWTKTLIRIVAAAALSYPATYAARESSKHRKLENYNRKLELELSSIESFIELLPEEKKQEIKSKLAERYFGSTLDQLDDTDLKSEKDFSLQSIERLFQAVKSLRE